MNAITFTEKDLSDAIDELRNTAVSGPDDTSALSLKKCKSTLLKHFTDLFKAFVDQGIAPLKLIEAHIIPIFKEGHQAIAENYRLVALTLHLSKVFENVIRNMLVDFIQEHKLINGIQHGFTLDRSYLSPLLAHHDDVLHHLECGLNVDTIYLDSAKAFGKVDYAILLKKLSLLGMEKY